MQANTWLAVFKRMPQSQHDNLSLVTNIGNEIAIQQIVRLERDFMVVRGRMTGTMDTGVIIVVPYDQISYMNFVKKMPVDQANELFKNFQAPPLPAAAAPAPAYAQPAGFQTASQYLPSSQFHASSHSQTPPAEEFQAVEFSPQQSEAESPAAQEASVDSEDTPKAGGKSGSKAQPISKTVMLARLRARLAAEQGKGGEPG
jgi:hypothetical protein